jgi:hypothetical protein
MAKNHGKFSDVGRFASLGYGSDLQLSTQQESYVSLAGRHPD